MQGSGCGGWKARGAGIRSFFQENKKGECVGMGTRTPLSYSVYTSSSTPPFSRSHSAEKRSTSSTPTHIHQNPHHIIAAAVDRALNRKKGGGVHIHLSPPPFPSPPPNPPLPSSGSLFPQFTPRGNIRSEIPSARIRDESRRRPPQKKTKKKNLRAGGRTERMKRVQQKYCVRMKKKTGGASRCGDLN